jgi:DNA polymerase-1
MSKVFLVDGSSVLFRSYHGIKELSRSDGMATNAIYGYLLTIRSLLNEYHPREMVIAFDRREKTFRDEKYSEYKANRTAPPEDLIRQVPYIRKITELLGIPQIEKAGFEADDLIGSMAVWLSNCGRESVIVSLDKDLMQLVNDSVSLLRLTPTRNNKMYTPVEVKERYGVGPEQLIDIFALMGDSVDNIPGVPGIGEKTALSLILEFGSLEGVYENLDKIRGKRQQTLREHRDKAFLSRELVTIDVHVPLELNDCFFQIQPADACSLCDIYQELEFRTFAAELTPQPVQDVKSDYRIINTADDLRMVIRQIQQKGFCAVDTETDSLDPLKACVVGISISIEENQGWYIPLAHRNGKNLPREEGLPLLKSLLESTEIKKTGHHLKFDTHTLANETIFLQGITDDTLIASNLVMPELQSHKLDDLAFHQLNMQMTPITELIGKGKGQCTMADVEIEKVSRYACEDTDATWRLHHLIIPRIRELDLECLYRDVEIPLLQLLVKMERKGILVDPLILQNQSRALEEDLKRLAQDIYQSVGREFNLNSPLQLAQILYDDLKILSGRKRSTRADILEKLAEDGVPIANQILEYRQLQKIKSTYLDALRKLIDPVTGRLHTTFSQTVANTGRISSSDPNLQNIPIRTDVGRRVRKAFLAAPGTKLLSLDYSQIELRVLAHISKDPGLLRAFAANEDIHARTAADVFGVAIDEVTSDMRRKAKEINFGLNYGMSPYGLARRLGISDKEASNYIETYFYRFPRVQTYMDDTVTFAQNHRFVKTLLGRRVPTLDIHNPNRMRQENARRAAINAPIQGSAADLLKTAMVAVDRHLNPEHAAILLTVHDELILEVKEDQVDEVRKLCQDWMENALKLDVPTPVDYAIGNSWAELN